MSKAKPWPTVANRHRMYSIFYAGDIRKCTEELIGELTEEGLLITSEKGLLSQLRSALVEHNISLALLIITAMEGQVKTINGHATQIIEILENAPSDNRSNGHE